MTPAEYIRELGRLRVVEGCGVLPSGFRDVAYERLITLQEGCCAICLKPEGDRHLAVDHCHTSGQIRGLLCTNCNAGLGMFGDDVLHLAMAIQYMVRTVPRVRRPFEEHYAEEGAAA